MASAAESAGQAASGTAQAASGTAQAATAAGTAAAASGAEAAAAPAAAGTPSAAGGLSPDELMQLATAPVAAAGVVITASISGPSGIAKEVTALTGAVTEAVQAAPPGSLLNALSDAVGRVTQQIQSGSELANIIGDPHEAEQKGLEACRQAAALVDARLSPEDAAAYKTMLIEVANRVAHAAKEGGFLGIGGKEVSPQEEQALASITAAVQGTA
jgi:hypothetical protein